jgi:hypothetical protein
MLYDSHKKNFKHHVHPSLQRRIKIFMVIAAIMLAVVAYDVIGQTLRIELALLSLAIGAVVGFASTRIFHLSWSRDGSHVVGRIDRIGWMVLAAYIIFEIARATFFQWWLPASATAITFAFVASALISRVVGLRGRIIRILKEEKIIS